MKSDLKSGTPIYECTLDITGVTDFGFSLERVLSGEALLPQGVRIDAAVSGDVTGDLINGRLTGIDYLYARADGRMELHIHTVINTQDSANLSMFADGIATPQGAGPNLDLRENATLFSGDSRYEWVNGLQIWGSGVVDLENQQVIVKTWVA